MTPRFTILNTDGHIIAIRHSREAADDFATSYGGTVHTSGDGNAVQVKADESFNERPEIKARTAPRERQGGQVLLVMVGAEMPGAMPATVDQARDEAGRPDNGPMFEKVNAQPVQGLLI